MSREARDYKYHASRIVNSSSDHNFFEKRIGMRIFAYTPDERRRDLDNVLKILLDSIQKGGLYDDDSQIDCLSIERMGSEYPGRLDVTIYEIS